MRGTVEPPAPIELVVCSAGRAVAPRGEPREHYETSPEEVNDPSEHATRLVWPLAPKED